MIMLNIKNIIAATAAYAVLALPAFAEETRFTADLTAGAEVPSIDSSANGSAEVTVDTDAMTISWVVTVQDLTGEATAAHVHGPASVDENAPPVIDMSSAIIDGNAEITEDQMSELQDGNYYVNVHTEEYPEGEIRGQLAAPE